MKKISFVKPHYIIRLLAFWLLLFALYRLVFIIYHHTKIPNELHSDTGLSFLYALRLDLSAACVAVFIPYVLWSFQQFYKRRSIHLTNKIFNLICIVLVSVLSIANLKIL